MRDIIWTLIVVWLIYKIVEVFRSSTVKRSTSTTSHNAYQQDNSNTHKASRPESDIRNAVKKHLNNEGEYVDFEEVK